MTEPQTPAASRPLRSFSRSLPMALLQARESVMVRFRPMLREHGLTEQQWRVLRAMSAAGRSLRPMEMAQMTFISMPSLSRLLKTLEAKELIHRSRLNDDLRGAEFGLTEAGCMIVAEIAPHSESTYAEIENLVGAEDVELLYQVLERVVGRLGVPSDGPDSV
ncbi:MarR family transcriptional regulator [Achromobacter sp. HZ01]|uniref:homoprotocatechuate degradation operon regulator HpaR n=1 Tax=Achromobacter sp. HZ01 TaxID=1416886 RepID=UPI000DC2319A|nr:homoprotocatechuate degradation operon regulator HpaR [Achromobacter sp. HZ01]RAP62728.1 MarR family transcriptional regulator [Achromobacter sp. HZ01]